jgi:hypothetical protein
LRPTALPKPDRHSYGWGKISFLLANLSEGLAAGSCRLEGVRGCRLECVRPELLLGGQLGLVNFEPCEDCCEPGGGAFLIPGGA